MERVLKLELDSQTTSQTAVYVGERLCLPVHCHPLVHTLPDFTRRYDVSIYKECGERKERKDDVLDAWVLVPSPRCD